MTENLDRYPYRGHRNEFGRTFVEELHYRWELLQPNNLGRMAAGLLAGPNVDIHNLPKEHRLLLGLQVSELLQASGMNYFELVITANSINEELAKLHEPTGN